jgi:uncharacterized protein (TIGR03663 family)
MRQQRADPQASRSAKTFPFTVEIAVWAAIAVAAVSLRLAHLDAAPLSAGEARQAMLAWRAVTGQGAPEAGYSPLLLSANGLLFFLCGTSDRLARLWPALFGAALVLMPFLFRQRIGRGGALVTGLYLLFSPTASFASRQLDGAVVAAVGGMAFLAGLLRAGPVTSNAGANDAHPGAQATQFSGASRRSWLILSAVGLALAVTGGALAYGLLFPLGLAWVGLLAAWRTLWAGGEEGGQAENVGAHPCSRPVESDAFPIADALRRMVPVFLLAVLAISTGLGWNPGGLGAVGGQLLAWIARFGPRSDPVASPLALLATYEPFALLFGLGGLVWAVRRGHRFGVLLGLWACLGALLLALMPARGVLDVLWVLLPLAMLAGMTVERLVRDLRGRGEWLSEGLYVPVVVILWVHLYLMLARYSVTGTVADLALAALAVVLQMLLALMFVLALRFGPAWRAVLVGTGIALLALTLSAGWQVSYVRPADPREPLVDGPTTVEVRDLVQTLRDLSWRRTGIPTRLSFVLESAPDSVLAWYLRDFSAARRVERLSEEVLGPVLVTSRTELSGVDGAEGEYVGQDFALSKAWDPVSVRCVGEWPPHCAAAAKWLLFRETVSPPVVDRRAVLWLRQDVLGDVVAAE